jgi:hypothetical protein
MAHGTGATAGARGPPGAGSPSSAAASCAAPVASPADDPASAVKCRDGQEEEGGCGQTSKAARRFHDPDDSNRHARRHALETSGSRRVDCARECQTHARSTRELAGSTGELARSTRELAGSTGELARSTGELARSTGKRAGSTGKRAGSTREPTQPIRHL